MWLRATSRQIPRCVPWPTLRGAVSASRQECGPATSVQPLWQALYETGCRHHPRRPAIKTTSGLPGSRPPGWPVPANGIQQFMVGTGGQTLTACLPRSRTTVSCSTGPLFGVLKLTLGSTGYSWEFVPVAGSTFSDAGSMDFVVRPARLSQRSPYGNFHRELPRPVLRLYRSAPTATAPSRPGLGVRGWISSTGASPTHLYPPTAHTP